MEYFGTPQADIIRQAELGIPQWTFIWALDGDDLIFVDEAVVAPGGGTDTIYGASPYSSVSLMGIGPASVDLEEGRIIDQNGVTDILHGINSVHLGGARSQVYGSKKSDSFISSYSMGSFIDGRDGVDFINYGPFDDFLMEKFDDFYKVTRIENGAFDIVKNVEIFNFLDRRVHDTAFGVQTFRVQIGAGDPIFSESRLAPQQVLWGDFNGDGVTDVAVPFLDDGEIAGTATISILLGDGRGSFRDATRELFGGTPPAATYPARVLGGDFNQDGRTDIFVLETGIHRPWGGGGQNRLLLSTPGGGMRDSITDLPQRNFFAHGGAVGDINRDGILDAVSFNLNVPASTGRAVQILLGAGSGTLREADELTPAAHRLVFDPGSTWGHLADVDVDGWLDLIVGTWNASSTPSRVYLNDGRGSFANAIPIDLPRSGVFKEVVQDVEAVDINGDNFPDLLISITNGGEIGAGEFYTAQYVQVLINDGEGRFRDETLARMPGQSIGGALPKSYKFIQPVDINSDGAVDLLASDSSEVQFSRIFINDGSGRFMSSYDLPGGNYAAFDANGDGRPEIVGLEVHYGSAWLTVWAPNLPAPAIARQMHVDAPINDFIVGSRGGDIFAQLSSYGDDNLIGGYGIDLANLSSVRDQYVVKISSDGATYVVSGPDGTDRMTSIERLRFADGEVWIEEAAMLTDAVHRFFNTTTGAHFFTASNAEANMVRMELQAFEHEGLAWRSASEDSAYTTDIFRFYNSQLGYHFYTASIFERDKIIATLPQYNYEGVAYQAYNRDGGTQEELYRFFNTATGAHFFTTSESEMESVRANLPSFNYEGIAFYVDMF